MADQCFGRVFFSLKMVPGPSAPVSNLLKTISMILRKISGIEEPIAISVRFATVAFQNRTFCFSGCPSTKIVICVSFHWFEKMDKLLRSRAATLRGVKFFFR